MKGLEHPRVVALLLLGAVLALYLNSLENSFQYDDQHAIVENPHIRSLGNLPGFFLHPEYFSRDPDKAMYRPLVLFTLALNYRAGGYAVWGYHLVNMALHGLCSLLVWAVLRQVGRSPAVALMGGLVFAAHPLGAEPVNYISSRSELLAAAGVLGGFWFDGRGNRVLALVCFALGLGSKESAIVLPALLACRDYSQGVLRCGSLRRYLPYILAALCYLGGVRPSIEKAVFAAPVRSLAEQWGTQAKALPYYLKLLLMPTGLSVHHAFTPSPLWSGVALLGLLAVMSILIYCLTSGAQRQNSALGAGWMLIALAPTSLVPLNILVNEHRLYLPLAGLLIWLTGLGLPRLGRGWLALPALLGALTVERNRVWKDEGSLWADALRKAPAEVRPYVFLGNWTRQRGELERAVSLFQRAIELDPGNLTARSNLGTTYKQMGEFARAIEMYRAILAEQPHLGEVRYNLGRVYQEAGQDQRAREAYQQVPQESFHRDLALNNLGTLYEAEGRVDSAYAFYCQALAHKPDSPDARRNCQRLLGELPQRAQGLIEQGRAPQAERWCRQVLEEEPRHRDALFFLAVSLFAQGRYSESIAANQRLVEAHPDFAEARLQLANALETGGRLAEALQVYEELGRQSLEPELQAEVQQRRRALERRMNP